MLGVFAAIFSTLFAAPQAAPLQTVASDATGHFRFERVLPGANARPDAVGRNSLEGPGFANVDLRWSRDFVLAAVKNRKRTLAVGVDAFNVLNRVNYNNPVGNLSSPFFGQAISAQPPRRIQFSMRVRY